jgi:hypothetical protein
MPDTLGLHLHTEEMQIGMSCLAYGHPEMDEEERAVYDVIMAKMPEPEESGSGNCLH